MAKPQNDGDARAFGYSNMADYYDRVWYERSIIKDMFAPCTSGGACLLVSVCIGPRTLPVMERIWLVPFPMMENYGNGRS